MFVYRSAIRRLTCWKVKCPEGLESERLIRREQKYKGRDGCNEGFIVLLEVRKEA